MRILTTAISASLALALAGCGANTANRSNYSVNQPVVERQHLVLDLNLSGGTLPTNEQRRLAGWFDALDLGYGDRVSIDDPAYGAAPEAREAIAQLTAQRGLLLNDYAPVTTGNVPPGAVRVVVSRSIAYVPDCPNWQHRSHTDFQGRTSDNYGCATNGNLAAMMADPEDLVRGNERTGEDQGQASQAIRKYRNRTGASGQSGGPGGQ